MAKSYQSVCYGHNSIYTKKYLKDNYSKRTFNIRLSTPDSINNETGILLFIAGYGASSSSNVYEKMRNEFADKFNLITIQCDYFGYEYMQNDFWDFTIEKLDLDKLIRSSSMNTVNEIIKDNSLDVNKFLNSNFNNINKITIVNKLDENIDNFNDMGIMQALDNIVATLKVIKDLEANNLKFNKNKVIIMGNSHGGYLGYLCNAMCRGLYTHILDNSAWIYPIYYSQDRYLYWKNKNAEVESIYRYMIRSNNVDIKPLNIKSLYSEFFNLCKIVVYHGEDDTLITARDKYNGIGAINNISYNLIRKNDVDNIIFKSSSHGLGANFIELFNKFYKENCENIIVNNVLSIEESVEISDCFSINYKSNLPELII